MFKKKHAQNGYTLIEILVSLTIIGLIFAIGFVSFREFSRRQQLIATARNLEANLRLTQEQVLSGKKPTGCAGVLEGYSFGVLGDTSYQITAICETTSAEVKTITLPDSLTVELSTVNPIIFKPLGLGTNIPEGGSAVFTLTTTATGATRAVTVSSTGEIK